MWEDFSAEASSGEHFIPNYYYSLLSLYTAGNPLKRNNQKI